MADPDIVVRLRQGWLAHWDTDVRFVMVYASEWVRLTNLTPESADESERVRSERDEARREVCELRCNPPERFIGLPHELAKVNGWDCFPEATP